MDKKRLKQGKQKHDFELKKTYFHGNQWHTRKPSLQYSMLPSGVKCWVVVFAECHA